ncbi:MAG: DJ-1/PfpI family protein [candidate division Zixibacteria bacterium]|nr:DJ-1/PfpI family protein [candidate division Zixibacteria bacterium]
MPTDSVRSDISGINVLLLMNRNYGVNYFLSRDLMEQDGWHVTHTGVLDTIPVCGYYYYVAKIPSIIPDIALEDVKQVDRYDAVMVMPSTNLFSPVPFDEFLESPVLLKLIGDAAAHDRVVSATCAGVRVLAAADVIRGKNVVGNDNFKAEFEAAGATFIGKDHGPVIDGNVVTYSRGLYNHVVNANAVARAVEIHHTGDTDKDEWSEITLAVNDTAFAPNSIRWAKTYGGAESDGGRTLAVTPDGGFFIAGYTFSRGMKDADMLAIKTDADGNVIWSTASGGNGAEYANACLVLDDGFLLTGYTTSTGAGSRDIFVVKLDTDGNQLWAKTYGGENSDVGAALCETDNGDIIIAGYTDSFGAGEEDVYVVRIDPNGNELWSKTYGGERYELANSIVPTGDGNYLIGASTGTFGKGNSDFYLIQIDGDGNEIKSMPYGSDGPAGHGLDWCRGVISLGDRGYAAVGYSDCTDMMNARLVMIDRDGNEVLAKMFGGRFYDYGTGICPDADGGVVICRTSKKIGEGIAFYDNDIYLVRLDRNGEVLSERTIGTDRSDRADAVCCTKNGTIAVVGQTDGGDESMFDICLITMTP